MDKIIFERIKARTTIDNNGCWIWLGAKNRAGYGNIFAHGKYLNSHRAMLIAIHGEIADGLLVCHACDNPSCVNPDHLFLGTQRDNMQDKKTKGRAVSGPASKSEWWTAERKKQRSEQARIYEAEKHASKASKAGVPTDWKYCPSCGSWFSRDQFYKNKARDDGLKPHCKPCSVRKDIARRKSQVTI